MALPAVAPVTVREQLVPTRVHVAGEGKVTAPVPVVFENVIVSPAIEPEAPVTVAVQLDVAPTDIDVGVHVTAVAVEALTARTNVPVAGPFAMSPAYEAWTVADPTVCPVTVMEQVPAAERVHVAGEGNVTPPLPALCVHDIVPPVTAPENPVSVAVHVVVPLIPTEAGVHEAVRAGELIVRAAVPELARLLASPG